jgi:hypothetical protein
VTEQEIEDMAEVLKAQRLVVADALRERGKAL